VYSDLFLKILMKVHHI